MDYYANAIVKNGLVTTLWQVNMNQEHYQERFGFSKALDILKSGGCVARLSWQDAKLYLVQGSLFAVTRQPLLGILTEGQSVYYQGHIDILYKTNDVYCASTWTPSNLDLLGEDWVVVEMPACK